MQIITGDCLEELQSLEANSVHAVVTDPPYGLAFMGKSWDDFEPKEYQEWCEKWATEVKRVLKPGGHMLAFSGNRTHHRLFTGVEDAGFEIRDTITWHYGSGFPKALDVSKSIDKQAGEEREVVGKKAGYSPNRDYSDDPHEMYQRPTHEEQPTGTHYDKTEPATDAAEQWDGFKTALKPATEYVVVARNPFSQTVAENVQEHGTGALNIDGTRIRYDSDADKEQHRSEWDREQSDNQSSRARNLADSMGGKDLSENKPSEGRYPANVIFGEQAAEALDKEVGDLHESTESTRGGDIYEGYESPGIDGEGQSIAFGDSGGPSRYFYTSKATKAERTLDGKINNAHPTVKPTDLMEWLVTLVTAEEQTVLDPFAGSGTTGIACKNKNRDFVGIERNEDYADIARVRCGLEPNDPSVVREDKEQNGLEQY